MPSSSNSATTRRWPRGWMAACLALSLSACAGGPRLTTVTKTEKQFPPESLLVPTAEPLLAGDRNRDLLDWGLGLRDALGSCNADKAALRKWSEESPPGR